MSFRVKIEAYLMLETAFSYCMNFYAYFVHSLLLYFFALMNKYEYIEPGPQIYWFIIRYLKAYH